MSFTHRIFSVITFIGLVLSAAVAENPYPQRVILNLTPSPATSIAVTWRTEQEYVGSEVQYAVTTQWRDFTEKSVSLPAKCEKFDTGDQHYVCHYSAVMENLMPNTIYIYRVGHDSVWSPWQQFTTANEKPVPFKFVYLGDPQDDIRNQCTHVFQRAFRTAPDASFWLYAGDMVTTPRDDLWGELFDALGFISNVTPSVMIPGNHDQIRVIEAGRKISKTAPIWFPHFTLPENGLLGLGETSYYFDYQGVRFIMLNSNEKLAEQAAWMDNLLAENQNRWTIVCFHHPLYSMGGDRDDHFTRDAFLPVFDKHQVDLVLQGHDHVYARTHPLCAGKIASPKQKGTVYLTSVSGPKAYKLGEKNVSLMAKTGSYVELFQIITVRSDKLNFKSYTANGLLFDEFELNK